MKKCFSIILIWLLILSFAFSLTSCSKYISVKPTTVINNNSEIVNKNIIKLIQIDYVDNNLFIIKLSKRTTPNLDMKEYVKVFAKDKMDGEIHYLKIHNMNEMFEYVKTDESGLYLLFKCIYSIDPIKLNEMGYELFEFKFIVFHKWWDPTQIVINLI